MAPTQQHQRKHYAAATSLSVFHTGGPLALSPDGTLVACCCHDAVSIVEVATGRG
jgi:hypothetical protein